MTTLYLDTETFGHHPIDFGAHAYAEQAEVILIAVAVDDGPVAVWDTTDTTIPLQFQSLQTLIDHADEIVLHGSAFDRTVLRIAHGVIIPTDKITDTMVIALQHSLPAKLEMLCDVLGLPTDKAKDKAGKKLIQLFCKPRPKNMKLRRATRETHPYEWQAFIEYARSDVVAMREVCGRMPRWNCSKRERDLWLADQTINDRGVHCDIDLARAALRAFERASRSLAARATDLTGGSVDRLTQRQKLLDHLETEHGFASGDLKKGTVAAHLDGELDPEVRELLEIRQQAAATSPAKYNVVLQAASPDGRLRGTIQFCGASRTGRDAGRIFQPQNLPRPTLSPEDVELGIEALKLDCEDLIFDNVSELCSSAVRGVLVAEPGKKLVVADLSNIEGRVLAWLAGEDWKVKAFYEFDRGVGHDLYKITAGRILGKDPGLITKLERQLQGKVPELAGGYQGSIGAYRTMGGPVFNALSDEEILTIVYAWRGAHPETVNLWYNVERAAVDAIKNPGEVYEVRGLRFAVKQWQGRDWLLIKLPSGRFLSYPDPQLDWTFTFPDGTVKTSPIGYSGVHQTTKQWTTLGTYGGKLVENIVQAIARDIFMGGMLRAEENGYTVGIRVHDELVCETPDDPAYTEAILSALMARGESWTTGLPLAAKGHEMSRYAKLD